MWDPKQYLRYGDERGRAFVELIARVGADDPADVVDLGCGPGNLTRLLTERWPSANVVGIDSSAEMIAAAASGARLEFRVGDLRDWEPSRPVDVLVSNATLQWVPGHVSLLPRLVGCVADEGWFAFQVPGNFSSPSHVLLEQLIHSARWSSALGSVPQPSSHDPAVYLDTLSSWGCEVDAWETTYVHVLRGADPVLEWVKGTALRPLLAALAPGDRTEFLTSYRAMLREAYPPSEVGTVYPFRRVFAVARRVQRS
jgi:trans-aconitate 2-methyltransferase